MGYDSNSVKVIDKLPNGVYELDMLSEIPKKGRRSTVQNAYYWFLLEYLTREVDNGYDKNFFHDSFRMAYFGIQEYNGLSSCVGSTTQLTTVEMEDYLQMIRDWAFNKLNVILPKPNESGFNY
jgi:hypothetical protein